MKKFGALKHFISTSGALLMNTLMSSEVWNEYDVCRSYSYLVKIEIISDRL